MSEPVFIVLGAAGGIGAETARRLESTGTVVRADHDMLDARDVEAVEAFVQRALDTHGRVDGIANCVGSLLLKPAHRTSPSEWDDVLATNLGSAFATVRAAAPAMRKTGGSIVLVSSAAARHGFANHEAIAAAKAGVIGLARSAAATYASWGVRVNAVAPGLVRTPLAQRLIASEAAEKASAAMHAARRIGEPGDIAAMIAWLLDPAQTWITGQVFGVDGGIATVRPKR